MTSSQIEEVYCTNGYASGPAQAWVVIGGESYKIKNNYLLQILQAKDVVGLRVKQSKVYKYVEVL